MAHRVLRMWNDSGREASRDFVALFILDPAFPPLKLGAELAMQLAENSAATARFTAHIGATNPPTKKQSPALIT